MSAEPVSYAGRAGDERQAEGLWRLLDPGFLAEAGWDPRREILAPAPDHPLLGFRPAGSVAARVRHCCRSSFARLAAMLTIEAI
jgi:hypothetical protein